MSNDSQQMANAALVMSQAAGLVAEVCGMVAANEQRVHRGESLAYDEDAFQEAINRSGCYHNAVLETLRMNMI